jgi:hypothetical protein
VVIAAQVNKGTYFYIATKKENLIPVHLKQVIHFLSNLKILRFILIIINNQWHYSPDGRKPPLIRFHSLSQCE